MFDIKQRREELGLDQRDIAEACGVAVSTVSRWESGDIENMKRSYITKLADVLGVDSEEILSGTNSDSNTSYQKFLNICLDKKIKPSRALTMAGLSKATATKWKKGSIPSTDSLMRLSKALDVSIDDLLPDDAFNTGERIRLRREQIGMAQIELAEKIGDTKQNIYKYETGIVTNIPLPKIEAIACALDIEPNWLIGWDYGKKQQKTNVIETAQNIKKKEKTFSIYRITCKENGRTYIGSSYDPFSRFSQHVSELKASSKNELWQGDYDKYGITAFTFEVIATGISKKDRFDVENNYIASASQNNEQNYNIKGVFNYGDSDNWLRSARIERGYTQTDMAEKLGIKTSSYCQYETKKRRDDLTLSIVAKLSEVLGIPIDDIIKYELGE